jgi:hypothetical protein
MAHMVPREPNWDGKDGRFAERLLFDALRQLDDEHWVYHQYDFVTGDPLRDNEADIVVLHPRKGILVLECKGASIRRDGNGDWWRGHERLRKNPFRQVTDIEHALVELLRKRCQHILGWSSLPLGHGRAVVFPRATVDDVNLPADIPRAIVLDRDDLAHMPSRIAAIYRHFDTEHAPGLDTAAFKQFRKQVFAPEFRLVETLAIQIDVEKEELVRLSDTQRSIVRSALANKRMRIEGGPGTGKTLVALEIVRRLASEGARVLLLCFNRRLAEELAKYRDGGALPSTVEVTNFHVLCKKAAEDACIPFDPPSGQGSAEFWDTTVLEHLLAAHANDKLTQYDAIVVDEAQDIAAAWWAYIETLLRDSTRGRMYLLYDPQQNVFGRKPDGMPDYPKLILDLAYRSTRELCRACAELVDTEIEPALGMPRGEPPIIEAQKQGSGAVKQIRDLVTRLLEKDGLAPEQIAMLTPHRRQHSTLAEVSEIAGYPILDAPGRAGAVTHSTIGAFKGLEADVVIVLDLKPDDPRCSLADLYTACTRARHRLYILQQGDVWPRPLERDA